MKGSARDETFTTDRIAQDLVGFRDLLEFFFCIWRRVLIGMILDGLFPVRLLELVIVCFWLYTEL